MKNLVFLASYPKSGNTWFRAFLSALLNEKDTDLDINDMEKTPIASARVSFEDHTGLESSEITLEETELLRPYVYREISKEAGKNRHYMKVHDAYTKTAEDAWLFPPEITFGAIYFIRNPLDVAVSFSYHNSHSIDHTIKSMNNMNFALCGNMKTCPNQLRQKHLTWSSHVESWTKAPIKVCTMRYEDMLMDSFNTFSRAVRFLELEKTRQEIQNAIIESSFDKLRKKEEIDGFHEKPQNAQFFFREGKTGTWKKHLTPEQMCKIKSDHYKVMKDFGYLDENDEPVY